MSDEIRKEFERFMFDFLGVDVGGNRGITPSGHDGYVFEDDDSTTVCTVSWLSWNASREAMKPIKLPNLPSVHDGYTKHEIDFMSYAIDECKEAIQQAGYKVEE